MNAYRTSVENKVLVFKTDIKTKKEVKIAGQILDALTSITEWSIDIDDIDNVLRIVTSDDLSENDVIRLLRIGGFYGEVLPD